MDKSYFETHNSLTLIFINVLLFLGLVSFIFIFFDLSRGGVEVSLDICLLALAILMALKEYNPFQHKYIVYTILIIATLILISMIMSSANSNPHDEVTVLKVLIIVLSIHYLFIMRDKVLTRMYLKDVFMVLLIVTILWQFISYAVFHKPYGTFTNRHYLGNVSILTLPLVFYFFYNSKGLRKIIFSVAGVINVSSLIFSNCRSSWISITLGSLFGIMLIKGGKKWIGLLILVSLVVFILGVNGHVRWRMEDLLGNISKEERFFLWKDSMAVLEHNTLREWTIGHGIGSVRNIRYSIYPTLHFPHNFFIELLYDNGILGILLIVVPVMYLFLKLLKHADILSKQQDKAFLGCLLVVFISWFLDSSVVFPFYSKSALYPFSLILGCMVAWGDQLRCLDPDDACPRVLAETRRVLSDDKAW